MLTHNKNIINRKIAMMQHGITLHRLGKMTGYSIGTICKVINNNDQSTKNSRNVHEKIAGVLGISLADFWPELYGPDAVSQKINQDNISHDVRVSEEINPVN